MQGEFFKIETVEKIAKLQRENKRLKENCDETLINHLRKRVRYLEIVNEEHRKINGELREDVEELKKRKTDYSAVQKVEAEKHELQERINKAIEYIKENEFYLDYKIGACTKGVIPLLNILQGKSDE